MCGLFMSTNPETFKYLKEKNSYRGQTTFSQAAFKVQLTDISTFSGQEAYLAVPAITQDRLSLETNDSLLHWGDIHLGHLQAPTSQASDIHPAQGLGESFLWHNGILKESTIKDLQKKMSTDIAWDTELIAKGLSAHLIRFKCIAPFLSSLDGSFACLWFYQGQLYAFRNKLAPLFFDGDSNISSVSFKDSIALPDGRIFHLDLSAKKLMDTGVAFDTKNNPYNF